jgi:hypothetical protein
MVWQDNIISWSDLTSFFFNEMLFLQLTEKYSLKNKVNNILVPFVFFSVINTIMATLSTEQAKLLNTKLYTIRDTTCHLT